MPTLSELLTALKNADQPIEDMDAFITSVEEAHNDALSVHTAKVGQVTEELSKRDATINALKIKNYDLMSNVPAVDPTPDSGNDGDRQETISGIDSFFDTKD